MDRELYELGERVGKALHAKGYMLATAESCTGGWIAEVVTMVPGSSAWFDRGFVTYTNTAKREMLGVAPETLERHGAVSEEVVREMAQGAAAASDAQVAVSVSGVAGPSGGTPEKPVGTVCFGWMLKGSEEAQAETKRFQGDREAVRRKSVVHSLEVLLRLLSASAADSPPRLASKA